MFLSIFAATCRPQNILNFLDNLLMTCDDTASFEVLLKIDEGDDKLISLVENYKKNSPLNIKYLATPKLDGYYTLEVGYNKLLQISHPDTYFCWLLTDEIRFKTKGWDKILKQYINFCPDDIFRIKLSIFQLKNYNDFFECLPCPDNYAVTTRKWLEITGGWGHFWGPDSWHQCIDYFLSLSKNEFHPFGIWRSFPIYDIKIAGQEAGQGIEDPKKLRERSKRIWQGWQQHSSHRAQENFNKLAQRLNAHIYAYEKNIKQYIISEELKSKKISLYAVDGGESYQTWNYKVTKFSLKLLIGKKKFNLFHFFPKLYLFCWKLFALYKRSFKLSSSLKIQVNKSISLLLHFCRKIIKATIIDLLIFILKIISKTIEKIIRIFSFFSQMPYHYISSLFIKNHSSLTQDKMPLVDLYKKNIVKPIKSLLKSAYQFFNLTKLLRVMNKAVTKIKPAFLKKKFNNTNTLLFLFDGKNFKQIDS